MKQLIRTSALFAIIVAGGAAINAHAQLESVLSDYLVQSVVQDSGEVKEVLVPADEAEPGSTLEYVLTYTNVSDESLSKFVIKNAVPVNTSYVGGSSSSSVNADFYVSIDHGDSFEKPPVTRVVKDENGRDKTIVIPPEQYTTLQWRVDDSLDAGAEMSMRYRVTID